MKTRVRLLSLTVGATLVLLAVAGTLIVIGIFNDTLDWDIFGPRVEAVLWGVFGSSIALACMGVAMTIVLGTQEIVKAFRALQQQRSGGDVEKQKDAPKSVYARYVVLAMLFLVVTIALLSLVNQGVQKHRSRVFKRVVSEQMVHFQPRLAEVLEGINEPPRDHVPRELFDLIRTLDELSFIRTTTLYLPDSGDGSAFWQYTTRASYRHDDGFNRSFAARDYENAIVNGFKGNRQSLDQLNEETGFIWYSTVKNNRGVPVGVLRIVGNSRENFREYMLGS